MSYTQVYTAKSGVRVVNHAAKLGEERDSHLAVRLFQTYAKWYRRMRGTEPGPGQAGNVS